MQSRTPMLLAIALLTLPWAAGAQPAADRTVVRERVAPNPRPMVYQRGGNTQRETITRTVSIGANGEIDLSNIAGDITVSRGSGNAAAIEVVKTARAASDADAQAMLKLVRVEINERGNRVEVRTTYPDRQQRGERRNINVSTAYTVTAPAGARVVARSISGNIRVTDIQGELVLDTTSGNVEVTNAARVTTAKTVSGNVTLTRVRAESGIEAFSISGNVTLRDVEARRLSLNSISGNVNIESASCERVEAQTMSGNVVFGGRLAPRGRYDLKSHSGDVRLRLEGDTGFELDASTFSGTIRSDLPLTTRAGQTVMAPPGRGRSFRGTFGDGSAVVNATTFSGSVVVGRSK
jgi:DUF4097 and DUF4098 domain-containing protein YvlB